MVCGTALFGVDACQPFHRKVTEDGSAAGSSAGLHNHDWRSSVLTAGLESILGSDGVLTDPSETGPYGADAYSYHSGHGPVAVALPKTTEDVVAVVKLCSALGVPIVARGAGTSLEGHTTTPHRGCVVDLSQMDRVLAARPGDLDCTVQAGVTWMNLNETLRPLGLFLSADPGPGASIGGMVGTRCSGTNAHRYSTMRECVLSLTVVLPDGRVVKTGNRARKSSAGYDLSALFTGSEGTLGIVTEVNLRLQPLPEATGVAICSFPTVEAACAAVNAVIRSGVQLGAAELLDGPMVAAVNAQSGLAYPPSPHVLFKLTGSPAKVADDAARVKGVVLSAGQNALKSIDGAAAPQWQWSADPEGQAKLWHARKVALWSAQAQEPGRKIATTDVCVPLSSLPELMARFEAEVARGPLAGHVYAVAHAGDGNAHHFLAFSPRDPVEVAEAHRLADLLAATAIELEGSCTGEHGVGVGKRTHLPHEFGAPAIELMWAIKDTLDPRGIMNPGKKLPERGGTSATGTAGLSSSGSGSAHLLHSAPACCESDGIGRGLI